MSVPKFTINAPPTAEELRQKIRLWIGDVPAPTKEDVDAYMKPAAPISPGTRRALNDLIATVYDQKHPGTLGGIDEQVTALIEEIKPLHVMADSVKKALAKKWLDIDENGQPFTTRPSVPEPAPEPNPVAPVLTGATILCYCGTKNVLSMPYYDPECEFYCDCCKGMIAERDCNGVIEPVDGCRAL